MSDPQTDLAAAKARLSGFARSAPALMQGFGAISRQATQSGQFSPAQKELLAVGMQAGLEKSWCEEVIEKIKNAAKDYQLKNQSTNPKIAIFGLAFKY